MAKTLTPAQMLGELTITCSALTASGVDVFAGDKAGTDLVLSAATAQGATMCESCNGRSAIEATAHNTLGRYDRRDGPGRGGLGGGHGGRDRDRTSYSNNWRHGRRGDWHNGGSDRRGDHTRGYDARSRDGGCDRDRANFSSSRRRGGGGRGDEHSGRGGHAAFSARDATLFITHANYDEGGSPPVPTVTLGSLSCSTCEPNTTRRTRRWRCACTDPRPSHRRCYPPATLKTRATSFGTANMFSLRAEYDVAEDLRLSRITENNSTHDTETSASPSSSTTDTTIVAFSVERADDEPYHASMLTLRVDSEKKSGGVNEGIRRYNDMLATLGYTPGHDENDTAGGGTAYYNARAEIATTGVNKNVTAFEPTGRGGDYTGDGGEDEDDATTPVAEHEDRRMSIIMDSGAQSHNLQYLEAFGF